LHYVATVAIAFPALEPEGPDEFDLYEMDILFESDSPEQALKDAIAISKQSPTWRGFEYPDPPTLHAVRRIQHEYPHNTLPSWHSPQEWFHVNVGKIDRARLEALRAGDDVQFWYGFEYSDMRFLIATFLSCRLVSDINARVETEQTSSQALSTKRRKAGPQKSHRGTAGTTYPAILQSVARRLEKRCATS